MLVVASPKSASTSLKNTLCQGHGLEAMAEGLWHLPISAEFCCYSRLWTSHMRELNAGVVAKMSRRYSLARFHILPTRNNLSLLNSVPKVVLLRPPEDVLLALRRSIKTRLVTQVPIDFQYCEDSDEAWLKRANSIGLMEDMNSFHESWINDTGTKLLIKYDSLLSEPEHWIGKIEEYFGLNRSGTRKLRKDNYSKSWVHVLKHRLFQN